MRVSPIHWSLLGLLVAGTAVAEAPVVHLPSPETISTGMAPFMVLIGAFAPSLALAPVVVLLAGALLALWALGYAADREIRPA